MVEQQAWTADELRAFLRAAAGQRLFAALWVAAFIGMRRNEVLGLRGDDFDPAVLAVAGTRGKTPTPADASISTRRPSTSSSPGSSGSEPNRPSPGSTPPGPALH